MQSYHTFKMPQQQWRYNKIRLKREVTEVKLLVLGEPEKLDFNHLYLDKTYVL